MTSPIETLGQFYEAMHSTIPVRRRLTASILGSGRAEPRSVAQLREILDRLESIPSDDDGRFLSLGSGRVIRVDLSYEISELGRDLRFLEAGEEALVSDLAAAIEGFDGEVAMLVEALAGLRFRTFVTDRDGTVNHYCGRYASSVQSTYNAVFMSRFVAARTDRAVVLTSAPIERIGIADLTVTAPGSLIIAGSKGREYIDESGRPRRYPIDPDKQLRLDALNQRLDELLARPDRSLFALVGSGRQIKFGQTTIAYQDITGSIPASSSSDFRAEVHELVRSVDPDGAYFRIEDTGLDLELILTIEDQTDGTTREFDKGAGLRFLDADLDLEMERGLALVCGDTAADLTMMVAARQLGATTHCVFVTTDDELRRRVDQAVPDVLFVSSPDVLVVALDRLSRAEGPAT